MAVRQRLGVSPARAWVGAALAATALLVAVSLAVAAGTAGVATASAASTDDATSFESTADATALQSTADATAENLSVRVQTPRTVAKNGPGPRNSTRATPAPSSSRP